MRFLNTFRGRLLLILAVMLVATLGFQYYLNLLVQNENNEIREKQEQAIAAGFAIGMSGLTSTEDRIQSLVSEPSQTFFDENARQRIKDVLIINNHWQVWDSLSDEHLPVTGPNDELVYQRLQDLKDLPAPSGAARLGEDLKQFPNQVHRHGQDGNTTSSGWLEPLTGLPDRLFGETDGQEEVHAIPVDTSEGRWYVIVVLESERGAAAWRAARPLVFTLGVLLASSIITMLLVWRFTRPVANLSDAAREVAEGNLSVRVADAARSDEMGTLAKNFNEMAAELEKNRELEAQLQQAEKSAVVGRLGSAIAHEIRNPLNYINLTLDHLRTKFAPEESEKKASFEKLTGQLKDEVGRINQQISDFLNYSRPANPELRPLDARKVVEDSLRLIEPEAAEMNVTVSVVEHENVPQVMGDPEFLRSVFHNLFINALQAMDNRGGRLTVKISPAEEGRCVEFEVADTGRGIEEDNLSNIFEPYFSTKETGTGLGLAIVQKIIESHFGTIDVESEEGQGSKFKVRLPTAGASQ